MQKQVFLDYASATPVSEKVREAMLPFFSENFFNPSAAYLPSKHLRKIYEDYKDQLAHTIGAKGNDLVITAGATESINLAFTVFKKYPDAKCLILETEHSAVLESAKHYAKNIELIKVDSTGLIKLDDLKQKIDDRTVLISVALANNEIGTIQPLSEIAEIIKKIRLERLKNGNQTPIYLHSDASQAMNLIDLSISRLGVDLLTLNSAKIYGPKGIGALYVGRGIELSPIIFGGGQESGLRSGTENVANLVGFSTAAKLVKEHLNTARKKHLQLAKIFRESLIDNLKTQLGENIEFGTSKTQKITLKFLGNTKKQLMNFIPICFDGLDAERLIYKLEDEQIYLATGAACAASKGKKSHVLSAIGLTESEINGSLRISLGEQNTEEDLRYATQKIAEIVKSEWQRINQTIPKNQKTVYVGMSGGVDSSVSALLLKQQDYHVVGVYMKNWSRDLPGMKCPWAEDLADAKRVATKLDIEFKVFDFETEYRQKVVDYMLDEFKKGNTPNPDIMCNQEIKFRLFYDIAREQGADYIATGHYAKNNSDHSMDHTSSMLRLAKDSNKDQTYFLYRITKDAIMHTIFPLGELLKSEVKALAAKNGLENAYKKESMGVCFVGEVGMQDFLREYLKNAKDREKYLRIGEIREQETDNRLGYHDGAIFFTIGQRHGIDIGGGLPYYVVAKDMQRNIVYVSQNLNHRQLWTKELFLKNVLLRFSESQIVDYQATGSMSIKVRLRHRANLEDAILVDLEGDYASGNVTAKIKLVSETKNIATGQSVVIYQGDICLGGGVLSANITR